MKTGKPTIGGELTEKKSVDKPDQLSLFPSDEPVIKTISSYKIDFSDPNLFGLDDAAHEEFDLLSSYSLRRNDCTKFLDKNRSVVILRAPKGTGKTTLCRLLENEISNLPGHISILKYDSQISPTIDSTDLTAWIRAWKKNIAEAIMMSLAGTECLSIDPDMIDSVERAEARGVKRKNFVGLFIEHFKLSFLNNNKKSHDIDYEAVVKRINKKKDLKIWVFLDEIDQYFTLQETSMNKMAGVLIAAREMASYVSNLSFRITIKPTVFGILESKVPSTSNIRELIVDLKWDNIQIRSLLSKRIESYLERNNLYRLDEDLFKHPDSHSLEDWFISQVFLPEKFDLGKRNRPPHVILSSLGNNRPRWVIELCRSSAELPRTPQNRLITFDEVKNALGTFGANRIKDISSEYYSQCPQIETVINRFRGAKASFANLNLLNDYIELNITRRIDISISGVSNKVEPRDIAKLLYQIGFIEPKKLITSGKYEFSKFGDRPGMIGDERFDDLDDNIWDIHPAFRNVLLIGSRPNKDILLDQLGDGYCIVKKTLVSHTPQKQNSDNIHRKRAKTKRKSR